MSQIPTSQSDSEVARPSELDSSMRRVVPIKPEQDWEASDGISEEHRDSPPPVSSPDRITLQGNPDSSGSSVSHAASVSVGDKRAEALPPLETCIHRATTVVFGYLFDVLAGALRLMKAPLSLLVYIVLLTMMCTALYLGLRRPAMQVICQIPGAGWLTACEGYAQAQVLEPNVTMRADFPGLMALQNDALDRLLVQSSAGSQLAFDVKRAEVLVRGLTSYINHSTLENRALIASLLSQFVVDAKDTGRDMQKLSSKLYSAVASVTAFTEYAGSAISDAKASSAKDASLVLQRMFQVSMDMLSEQIARTLKHATNSMERLDRLEESMATIHDVLVKEDSLVIEHRNRLAADLWTRLGWNADELRLDDTQLKLLGSVQDYRVQALNHIINTMQTLDAIDADLVELQSQLSVPTVVMPIPVEVQLASIRDSVRRLRRRMEATTGEGSDGAGMGSNQYMQHTVARATGEGIRV